MGISIKKKKQIKSRQQNTIFTGGEAFMAEVTTPRLMAAVKEFNVGKDTLVDFLVDKGFSTDDLKPTSKLTEEMYRALQQEFQGDKVAKEKSDRIDLPKGAGMEPRKKRDEEEILFKKDDKKTVAPPPPPAPPVEETPVAPVPPVPVVEIEKPKEEEKPAPVIEEETKKIAEKPSDEEPKVTRIEAPGIEGPKVFDKIDLSAIDSSTRPKKLIKKKDIKETKPVKEEKPVVDEKAKIAEVPEKQVDEPVLEADKQEEDLPLTITNIKAEKL